MMDIIGRLERERYGRFYLKVNIAKTEDGTHVQIGRQSAATGPGREAKRTHHHQEEHKTNVKVQYHYAEEAHSRGT